MPSTKKSRRAHIGENAGGSPLQFRHDSLLRVRQSPEPYIASATEDEDAFRPIQRPSSNSARASHSGISQSESNAQRKRSRRYRQGYTVLQSGHAHGTDYAVLKLSGEGIAVSGSTWLSVVRGNVSVCGVKLSDADRPVLVVSTPFAPFTVKITPTTIAAKVPEKEVPTPRKAKLHPEAIVNRTIRDSLDLNLSRAGSELTAVVLSSAAMDEDTWQRCDGCELSSDIGHTMRSMTPFLGVPSLSSGEKLVSGMSAISNLENIPVFEAWAEWTMVSETVSQFLSGESPLSSFRMLVCGTGGVGKSTFVRSLTNYLLSLSETVVLIDTDVGQPEMNIPGLVAAHAVSEMRLGAAIASNRSVPISSRYFGETTPREEPDTYAECVTRVCHDGLAYAEQHNCPVVVNSDGWVSGVGGQLMHRLVSQTAVSHVAHLRFPNSPRIPSFAEVQATIPSARWLELTPSASAGTGGSFRGTARELHIAAYFSKELALGRVMKISITSLAVFSPDARIDDPTLALMTLNGSIVALAESCESSVSALAPSIEHNVLGFGLVRGIDLDDKMVYMCTPLCGKSLRQCTVIVISGGIVTPPALLTASLEGGSGCAPVPYVLKDHISTGESMYSRPSLVRHAGVG